MGREVQKGVSPSVPLHISPATLELLIQSAPHLLSLLQQVWVGPWDLPSVAPL